MGILGEQSKWIPVSPQRVLDIEQGTDYLIMQLQGALDETVLFSFIVNEIYMSVNCHFIANNQMKIKIELTADQPEYKCN